MKKNYTHLVVLLDRSGSMAVISNDIKEGFKTFINDQKKLDGECTLTLVQFDNEYEKTFDFKNIQDFSTDDFVFTPRGSTALVESMTKLIEGTGKSLAGMSDENRPEKVIFLTITDGEENCSKYEYTSERLKKLVEEHINIWKWEFSYIGANQDSFAVARSFGINVNSVINYSASVAGTSNAFASMSANSVRYRSGASKTLEYTSEEQKLGDEIK